MLSRPEWEMHPYGGRPGFVGDDQGASRYGRYGRIDQTRPVVVLSHGGVLPQMLPQVLEEFRHFHNLWEDPAGGVLKKLLANGSEETVCNITQRHMRIRSSYLRRFQAATQLCLVRFVDSIVNTPNDQQWTAADLVPCGDQAAIIEEASAPTDADRSRVTQLPEPVSPSYRNRVRNV